MDMNLLPSLALEKIVQYLSNRDLAACCACSISWREAFDQNAWWEPRCDKMIAGHLRITECEVEPGFVSPEEEGSKLSPISEWRMSFMRETHLWRNWRHKRYVEHEIEVKHWEHFCFLTATDVLVKMNDKAEVWAVRKTPLCLGYVFTLNESDEECHIFEVFDDDKFVILQGITLHLYQISSPLVKPWKLIYTFKLTMIDQLSCNLREAHVSGDILVLFLNTGSVFSFDLNTKIISSESKVPHADMVNEGYYIYDILKPERKSMEYGVVMMFDPVDHYSDDEYEAERLDLGVGFLIFIYSASHKNFLNFKRYVFSHYEEFPLFRCILCDNYIAFINNGMFEITDFNTGESLVYIEVDCIYFRYMNGIQVIAYDEPLTDSPPISVLTDNDVDRSFRFALSKSLGIVTYTHKMFLQHICKHLNTQGNVKVYLLDHWYTNHAKNRKCNKVFTCVIHNYYNDLRFFKIW